MKFTELLRKIIKNLFSLNVILLFILIITWSVAYYTNYSNYISLSKIYSDKYNQTLKFLKSNAYGIYKTKDPDLYSQIIKSSSIMLINTGGIIEDSSPLLYLKGLNIQNSKFFANLKEVENDMLLKYPSLSDGNYKTHFISKFKNDYIVMEINEDLFSSDTNNIFVSIIDKKGNYLYSPDFIKSEKTSVEKHYYFSLINNSFYVNIPKKIGESYLILSMNITFTVIALALTTILIITVIILSFIFAHRMGKNIKRFIIDFEKSTYGIVMLREKLEKIEPNNVSEISFDDVLENVNGLSVDYHEIDEFKKLIFTTAKDISSLLSEINASYEELEASNVELENLYGEVEKAYGVLEDSYRSFSKKLSSIAEKYDDITGEHIDRVTEYSRLIAIKLGLETKKINEIYYYSNLHDIGKLFISKEILFKPGKLTDSEFNEMKKHTVLGGDIFSDDPNFITAKNIALYHHEQYDGSGYPFGLKNNEIPIEARIVSLADIYDALRSSRPYKEPFTHDEAFKIITQGDNRTKPEHFDPAVLRIFIEHHNEFDRIFNNSII